MRTLIWRALIYLEALGALRIANLYTKMALENISLNGYRWVPGKSAGCASCFRTIRDRSKWDFVEIYSTTKDTEYETWNQCY